MIKKYRAAFPKNTSTKKIKKGTLKYPATRVNGSPIIGIQENSSDQTPYFLKWPSALTSIFFLIGNQDFLLKPERKVPIAQFIIAPAVFPKVAMSARNQRLVSPCRTVAINTASDVAGIKVADRSEEKKTRLLSRIISKLNHHLPTTSLQELTV